jgi:hypothetical protein
MIGSDSIRTDHALGSEKSAELAGIARNCYRCLIDSAGSEFSACERAVTLRFEACG